MPLPGRRSVVQGLALAPAVLGTAGLLSGGPVRAAAAGPLAIVEGYMTAWNDHDAGRAAAFLAEDVAYYDASLGSVRAGRATVRNEVIQALMTAAPDCVWERDPAPAVVGEDAIAFPWTLSGTNTGPWSNGTPATGKAFSFHGLALIRIRGGKIAYQGDYYDSYGLYRQLGLAT